MWNNEGATFFVFQYNGVDCDGMVDSDELGMLRSISVLDFKDTETILAS